MRPKLALAIVLLGLFAPRSALPAPLLPTEQARSVSSCAGISPATPTLCSQLPIGDRDSSLAAATDFSDFSDSVSSIFSAFPGGGGVASADQTSNISSLGVDASGSVFSSAAFGRHVAEALSSISFNFSISTAAPFHLSGEIGAEGDASARVRLTGESGVVASVSEAFNPSGGFPGAGTSFSFSDVLAPGDYTLFANAHSCSDEIGLCGQAAGRGFYQFSFVVPEPTTAFLVAVGLILIRFRHIASARSLQIGRPNAARRLTRRCS